MQSSQRLGVHFQYANEEQFHGCLRRLLLQFNEMYSLMFWTFVNRYIYSESCIEAPICGWIKMNCWQWGPYFTFHLFSPKITWTDMRTQWNRTQRACVGFGGTVSKVWSQSKSVLMSNNLCSHSLCFHYLHTSTLFALPAALTVLIDVTEIRTITCLFSKSQLTENAAYLPSA